MLEKVKEFNSTHNNLPVKIAGTVVGAAILGAIALYLTSDEDVEFEEVEVETEPAESEE